MYRSLPADLTMLTRHITLISLAAALSACGGGSTEAETSPASSSASAPAAAPTPSPPGGLFVGYYAESAADNPEDPMLGAFVLDLPQSDGTFSGNMFFTYVGCQSSNVGTVSGAKAASALSGTWTGAIDGLPQSGAYSGSFDAAAVSYTGTYTNSGGKQHRDLRPCIEYDIAAHGSWEMFPVEAHVPSTFTTSIGGRSVSWSEIPGASAALVYVLDSAVAQGTGNPVVWQSVVNGSTTSVTIPDSVVLVAGRDYVAAVGVADADNTRAAFGSRRFTAP